VALTPRTISSELRTLDIKRCTNFIVSFGR
jgi:hypothetical protein